MVKLLMLILMSSSLSFGGVKKGLSKGSKAPQFNLANIKGGEFNLTKTLTDHSVVLVFYRGGWCPYCNLQLRTLQDEVLPTLKSKSVELVAISVDRLDEGVKTLKQQDLSFTVLSDTKASVLKKYKVDYKVPRELVKKYKKNYKINLERASGKKHHIIAIPAVYVINEKGVITFSYVNEDYKVRAQTQDILNAVEKL